jgi:hypothetical protein
MQLAEPERPRFHLVTAETILADIRTLVGTDAPKAADTRARILAHLKSVLADARKSAEAELRANGKGTRCAMNLSAAEDEIIRAIHLFAVRYVYPVDNPSGAEMISIAAVGGYGRGEAGALLRHRPAVPAALQADALGRAGRRVDPLRAVGPGVQGRPRGALGRRLPAHVQGAT